jgi:hypothetical protein
MWDEFIIGGEVQETSKKNVLKAISDQDMIMEVRSIFSHILKLKLGFLNAKYQFKM